MNTFRKGVFLWKKSTREYNLLENQLEITYQQIFFGEGVLPLTPPPPVATALFGGWGQIAVDHNM
jgi:hypothetical protein